MINRLNEIEDSIAKNKMSAAQVFTQMRQLIIDKNKVLDSAIDAIKSCEILPGPRIRLYEAIGAIQEIKNI